MSNNIMLSIESLPVELFYRIFDNLDAQTILFSVRPVCRLFQAIVSTYNRYIFDFKSISNSNFRQLCRLINPHNVISLTLSDNEHFPDQVALFISLVRLRQLTRLHSITFLGIKEFQLDMILKSINLTSLTSFSLNLENYDDRYGKTTLNLLSSILAQSSFRKFEFNMKNGRISNLSWPLNCGINYLIINNDITFHEMCKIFSNSPQLHTLILKQNLSNTIKNITSTFSFPQLTSLTIEKLDVTIDKLDVTIDKLESFLLLTPSLIHLKFIGEGRVFNGKRWENFIQSNLLHLNTFQFFVYTWRPNVQTREDLEFIIESFRSPFWTETKKWFVGGEFNKNQADIIQVYSIPICQPVIKYDLDSEKVFLSNSTTLCYDDPVILNNINEVIIPLVKKTNNPTKKTVLSKTGPLFPKATKLSFDFGEISPLVPTIFITSIIDIGQLVEVKFESSCFNRCNKDLLLDLITIIERSNNLRSLIIHGRSRKSELYLFLNTICSAIPRQIKHLQIPVNHLNQLETILERCQYLSTVQLEAAQWTCVEQVCEWFIQNTIDSIFRIQNDYVIIWIGKKTNQIKVNHKQAKLTDSE